MIRGLHRRLQAAGAVATASAVAAGACLWAAPVASADQLSTLRAQAQAVASQIDDLGRQEAALSEQYDGAVLGAQAAGAKVASATAELAAARAAAGRARSALASEVLDEYTGAANVPAEGGPRALDDASARLLGAAYVDDVASGQQDALDAYHLATVQATTAEAQLRAAQAAAVDQVHRVAGAKAAVEATQQRLVGVERQTQGQIATVVAQIQAQQQAAARAAAAAAIVRAQQLAAQQLAAQQAAAQQAAAARAAAAAAAQAAAQRAAAEAADAAAAAAAHQQQVQAADQLAAQQAAQEAAARAATAQQAAQQAAAQAAAARAAAAPADTRAPTPAATVAATPAPRPSGAGATGALQAALSRVGDPYVWGAAGPSTFDCSGLVQWAFAQVGISLPHYSGSQFAMGTRIPMSDLQPGDLVFFSDPGEHVAIYAGGGDIVEAPHTGADVRVVPMYSEFVQAVRIS